LKSIRSQLQERFLLANLDTKDGGDGGEEKGWTNNGYHQRVGKGTFRGGRKNSGLGLVNSKTSCNEDLGGENKKR